jgi:mono/diheme cytochrome c family protein
MVRAETRLASTRGGGLRNWTGVWSLPLALATFAGVASWFAQADPVSSTRSTAATEPGAGAAQLFQQRCARCHEEDGTGTSLRDSVPQVPNFRSHGWHVARSDAQLRVAILEGKGTRMPAFAGRLSDQEARELVRRVRAFDPTLGRRDLTPADDFDRRFRELQRELEDLKKQFRDLATERGKS